MLFYDLTEDEREKLVRKIEEEIQTGIEENNPQKFLHYFSNDDTYIRKVVYLAIGKLYYSDSSLQNKILKLMHDMFKSQNKHVRQTVVNALGEIGKKEAEKVLSIFEKAMVDTDHSVRNAVIGSLKKMGEKNPKPVLSFSQKFLHHKDPEIRRQAVHGIELRGRTHPEDILPILEQLQYEENRKVRDTVIHVLGQISYKKGCLEKTISSLKKWKNKEIVKKAIDEILETHRAYEKFSEKSYTEAKAYIDRNFSF